MTTEQRTTHIYNLSKITPSTNVTDQKQRFLETRVLQHKGYVRFGDENKALFLHIKNTNHSIAFQQASVMKYTNTYIYQ